MLKHLVFLRDLTVHGDKRKRGRMKMIKHYDEQKWTHLCGPLCP